MLFWPKRVPALFLIPQHQLLLYLKQSAMIRICDTAVFYSNVLKSWQTLFAVFPHYHHWKLFKLFCLYFSSHVSPPGGKVNMTTDFSWDNESFPQ